MKSYLDVSAFRLGCTAVLLAHDVLVADGKYIIQDPLIIRAPFGLLEGTAEFVEDNHLREGNGT